MTVERLYRLLPTDLVPASIAKRLQLDPLRLGALLGAIGLLVAFVTVLHELVTVTGDPRQLRYVAAGALLSATFFARYIRPRTALGVGFAALAIGLSIYLSAADVGFQPRGVLIDSLRLGTGMSVLQIDEATVWALSVTPAPIFLAWYFALRRRYGVSALVGSAAVGFFVLTGDADPTVTLLAVVAAAAMLGFGDLERGEGTVGTAEYLVPILVVMIVTPLFVSVIPAGGAPVGLNTGSGSGVDSSADRTMAGAVVETGDELDVVGSIRLSTDVHFTIRADRGQYWRTESYDRYTGDGWVKAAESSGGNEFRPAEEPTLDINQTVRVETRTTTMPASWRPFAVESDSIERSNIDTGATLRSERPLTSGEMYTVSSSVPNSTEDELRAAGSDYPSDIEETYTQLPSDVPDRVHERTEELVADAEDPYEATVTIEQYLRENKGYSLAVRRPDGDIADAFLFEMDAGYCTYFATTMVAMLRSQGIPARMAVGYSTGQQVGNDTWVVRGTNAHAWVEVYFPDNGWQTFEPTPPSDLVETQAETLETTREFAQEFDNPAFDTEQSWDVPPEGITAAEGDGAGAEPDPESESESESESSDRSDGEGDIQEGAITEETDTDGIGDEEVADSDDELIPSFPSTERLAVIALAVLGLGIWIRRSLYAQRLLQRVRSRYLPRADPATEIERAFERMLLLLERRYRQRRQGETVREYLAAIEPDSRVHRIAAIRERARYRGDVSEAMADEAVRLVDTLSENT